MRLHVMISLIALWAAAIPVSGQNRPLTLGDLEIPRPSGYVNDFAGRLSARETDTLEQMCRMIDRQTGAQIALVILSDLKGEDAREVKTRLFEAWRIGRQHDDRGLLILHALAERRIEVETGYGLEGILPDGRVGAILDQAVVPHFRAGDFYQGYRAGLAAFADRIAADATAGDGTDAYRTTRGRRGEERRGFPLGALLLAPVFLYLLIRHPRLLLFMLMMNMMGGRRGGMGGGFGGGFGGFGGGMSGGGGAGRSY